VGITCVGGGQDHWCRGWAGRALRRLSSPATLGRTGTWFGCADLAVGAAQMTFLTALCREARRQGAEHKVAGADVRTDQQGGHQRAGHGSGLRDGQHAQRRGASRCPSAEEVTRAERRCDEDPQHHSHRRSIWMPGALPLPCRGRACALPTGTTAERDARCSEVTASLCIAGGPRAGPQASPADELVQRPRSRGVGPLRGGDRAQEAHGDLVAADGAAVGLGR